MLFKGFTNISHIGQLELIPLLLILVNGSGYPVLKFTPLLVDLLSNSITLRYKLVVFFAQSVYLANHIPMLRIHRRKVLP
jgi:hypothetical protein